MEYTALWHPVSLPSKGKLYGELCPEGTIEITSWTTAQEEMIVRYGGTQPAKMMNMLCKDNVRLPAGLNYEDLLTTDKFFILLQLRVISLVPQYTVHKICAKCDEEYPHVVDLSKDLTVAVWAEGDPTSEPIEVKLPKSGVTVGLRYLRDKDVEAQEKYAKGKKSDPGDPSYRFKLARQIMTVDGVSRQWDEKLAFVSNLPMLDSNIMRNTLRKHLTGYNLDIRSTCPSCEVEEVWDLPMTASFFRASEDDIGAAEEAYQESGS